jgi:DNA-directed RNA polymerase specialized sigma24 family protein
MDEAEDVVQEAFMKAFIWLHQFRAKSRVETWLPNIVVNTA